MRYNPSRGLKMTFWQIFALDWYISRKIKKVETGNEPRKSPESRVDFDLSYATRKERLIGAFFLLVFLVIAIVCLFTSHAFYALLSFFAALCALIWPFLKQVKNETP
jgi:predicted RND superfamily exporter protein